MFYKSKFKDYVGILFYRHGLFCASNPVSCLLLVFSVVFLCCYPLRNLSSFSSSLEQYKQSTNSFDGLEANAEINQYIEYDRLADRPAWYNRVPISYIQRILVKSVLTIPIVTPTKNKRFANKITNSSDYLYLVDAFRTPLAQLFEINEFLRNFRTEKYKSNEQKSLIDDLCVHVGEIRKREQHYDSSTPNLEQQTPQQSRSFLPEFNCLYLSPTNFWSNDFNEFIKDDDIIQTINNSPSYFKNIGLKQNKQFIKTDPKSRLISQFYSFFNRIFSSSNTILDEESSTDLSELLFGVSWNSVVTSLKDDPKLAKKTKKYNPTNKSIILTYAITIALKNYDKSFIDELNQKLQYKFDMNGREMTVLDKDKEDEILKNTIFNLQYTSQSFVYYIPYFVLYFLLFLYIYISVRKIEFVKSKWGLAFAAVSQVVASLLMSIGICSYFGLTPTLNGGEIFPYLIIFIGFENIVVLTKSVVSTPFDLDVRYRIALGLKKESWLITKILLFELIIIFFGILTMVPAIQEFCVFAYVGLIIDFFMQMIFFVTVLSIDIRRMELTDLGNHHHEPSSNNTVVYTQNDNNNRIPSNFYLANGNDFELTKRGNRHEPNNHVNQNNKYFKNEKRRSLSKEYSNLLINKSVQFFYFWAKTRLVQRCVMILSLVWIILIFYKSLLVVELMRHDVNVSKETVDALLPKGSGLPRLIQDNFQQYIFTSSKAAAIKQKNESSNPFLTTIDYMKRNFKSFISINSNENKAIDIDENNAQYKSKHFKHVPGGSQNWQSLDYYHWLSLFANYNVSLYNRYVAILPEITINRVIHQEDILKFRNQNEVKKYNSILLANFDNQILVNNSNNFSEHQELNTNINMTIEDQVLFRWALFELIGIVILGIPTIYFIVYLFTLFYKCLCSKKYEQWRKTWSTANIKRQYKKIHSRANIKSCLMCDNNDFKIKNDCQSCKYGNSSDSNKSCSSFDSDYESEKVKSFNRKHSYSETSDFEMDKRKFSNKKKSVDQDALLNKIINGQKDDIELKPIIIYNSETDLNNMNEKVPLIEKYRFPIDLISSGSSYFATSDINNQIKIWALNMNVNEEIYKIDLNLAEKAQTAVWSMCLTNDDQHLFVGQSNGQLRLFDLTTIGSSESPECQIYESSYNDINIGITHLKELKSKWSISDKSKHTNHILLKNTEKTISNHLILISRLNGYLEIINCISFKKNKSNFQLIKTIKIYNSPITNLINEGDYLIATNQECLFKIFKINFEFFSISNKQDNTQCYISNDNENQRTKHIIEIVIDFNEKDESLITAVCIDKENNVSAATGSQNGIICLWNLFTGQCDLQLKPNNYKIIKSKKATCSNKESILQIELVQNFVISLNVDHQMSIWNRTRGELIKEFKFLSPIKNRLNFNEIDSGELSSTFDACNNSILNAFSGLIKTFSKKLNSPEYFDLNEEFLFKPAPTMCLYSKTILITGGCSCILLWNIPKGELVKKITIKKPIHNNSKPDISNKYSQNNFIKEIRLIERNLFEEFKKENYSIMLKNSFNNNNNNCLKNIKKLVLITDYTDTFYVLKIPSNLD